MKNWSWTGPQKFLIARLQHYLNKDNFWLEEFFKKKFHQPKLWALTMRQASAAIRLLLEFAARRDIKLRMGQDHKVSKAEINAEIPKIKLSFQADPGVTSSESQ